MVPNDMHTQDNIGSLKNNSKLCAIWRIFLAEILISRIEKYIFSCDYLYEKWILSIWFDGIVVLVVNSKKRCWSMLLAGKSSGGNIFRLHTSSSFDVLPHMSFSPMRAPTLYSCVLHVPTRIRNWHLFGSSSLIFRHGRVWMEPISMFAMSLLLINRKFILNHISYHSLL